MTARPRDTTAPTIYCGYRVDNILIRLSDVRPTHTLTMCVALAIKTKYSHIAMKDASNLDRTFRALADSTRRSMIHVLARGRLAAPASSAGSSVPHSPLFQIT